MTKGVPRICPDTRRGSQMNNSDADMSRTNFIDNKIPRVQQLKFKIIIPTYNTEKWIEKCMTSVITQKFGNYDVMVVDDCYTDNTGDIIEKFCEGKDNWNFIRNESNTGALYNIVNGIEKMSPKDNDVIITLDGDDWLYDENVLDKVAKEYNKTSCWLTYGGMIKASNDERIGCWNVDQNLINDNSYRDMNCFIFHHLRTFKYFLWKNIKDEDMRLEDGSYYDDTWDQIFMFPMVEMAGGKIRYIENELLLTYNNLNPLNHFKDTKASRQLELERKIRKLPKYNILER